MKAQLFPICILLLSMGTTIYSSPLTVAEEVQEWMDFFDTNQDGYLTLSEIYPSPLMPADLDAGAQVEFDVFDANNDGQIEASEFVNFFVAYDNAS